MLLTEYRFDLVIQALRSILPLMHPADAMLRQFFQQERIGSSERALVAETVFGVLRHRLFLEYACAKTLPRDTSAVPSTTCKSGGEAAYPAPDASQHRVRAARCKTWA